MNKKCAGRDSNPDQKLGRLLFASSYTFAYGTPSRWTTGAYHEKKN